MQNLSNITLKKGDIFLVRQNGMLSKSINLAQKIVNKDGRATYSHAGIIIDPDGKSFEALWRVESKNLFEHYSGSEILIARSELMNPKTFEKAFAAVKPYEGDFYPIYRLLFHLNPVFAKIATNKLVCSEIVARFLYEVDMFPYYNGVNPDNLHDFFCWGMYWGVVYKGPAA